MAAGVRATIATATATGVIIYKRAKREREREGEREKMAYLFKKFTSSSCSRSFIHSSIHVV